MRFYICGFHYIPLPPPASAACAHPMLHVVKLLVMVNADPQYERHFAVGNGASDLLVNLYGDQGRHARSAVGMAGLPLQAPVEVEMIVELNE